MEAEKREKALQHLVVEIERNASDTSNWTGRASFSKTTMAAMASVPREKFVQPGYEVAAFVNRPQPIGHGQTISQPYIVALMTDLLDLKGDEKVLEVGSGSGYQAAVLAEILRAGKVYTVEVVPALADLAKRRLIKLGYSNVMLKQGDGYQGWSEHAPYDAIVATAAPERLPNALIKQLKSGGRMVVPVGRPHSRQNLVVVEMSAERKVCSHEVLPVAFVPMVKPKNTNTL